MRPTPSQRLDYWAEGYRPWIILILFCCSLFTSGIDRMPVIDRDEARYVQATRQMLESGDYVQIRFQNEARNKKPVGIYWLQAGMVSLFSDAAATRIWAYRLVSFGGAMTAVLACFAFGAIIFDRRTALIGAALLAASLLTVAEAHLATTDAVLLATAMVAQGALAAVYLGARRGEPTGWGMALCFWLAIGVSILIKGPVVPGLSLLTAITLVLYDRKALWLRALKPAFGIPLALSLSVPWFILIEQATHGAFLQEAVGHDLLGKVGGAQEAHGGIPGTYVLLLPVTFWPGTLFLGVGAVWAQASRRLPAARFLMAWAIPFWILLECVPTKLPHYVLPLYPAIALIAARGLIAHVEEGMAVQARWLRWLTPILFGVVALALGIGFLLLSLWGGSFGQLAGAIAALIAVGSIVLVFWYDRLQVRFRTALVIPLAAMLLLFAGFQGILPGLDEIWVSRSIAAAVGGERRVGERVAAVGYAEASLVFLLGTDTALLSPERAAEALKTGGIGLVLVEDRQGAAFLAAAPPVHPVGRVSGFNYSNGHRVHLTLYRAGTPS